MPSSIEMREKVEREKAYLALVDEMQKRSTISKEEMNRDRKSIKSYLESAFNNLKNEGIELKSKGISKLIKKASKGVDNFELTQKIIKDVEKWNPNNLSGQALKDAQEKEAKRRLTKHIIGTEISPIGIEREKIRKEILDLQEDIDLSRQAQQKQQEQQAKNDGNPADIVPEKNKVFELDPKLINKHDRHLYEEYIVVKIGPEKMMGPDRYIFYPPEDYQRLILDNYEKKRKELEELIEQGHFAPDYVPPDPDPNPNKKRDRKDSTLFELERLLGGQRCLALKSIKNAPGTFVFTKGDDGVALKRPGFAILKKNIENVETGYKKNPIVENEEEILSQIEEKRALLENKVRRERQLEYERERDKPETLQQIINLDAELIKAERDGDIPEITRISKQIKELQNKDVSVYISSQRNDVRRNVNAQIKEAERQGYIFSDVEKKALLTSALKTAEKEDELKEDIKNKKEDNLTLLWNLFENGEIETEDALYHFEKINQYYESSMDNVEKYSEELRAIDREDQISKLDQKHIRKSAELELINKEREKRQERRKELEQIKNIKEFRPEAKTEYEQAKIALEERLNQITRERDALQEAQNMVVSELKAKAQKILEEEKDKIRSVYEDRQKQRDLEFLAQKEEHDRAIKELDGKKDYVSPQEKKEYLDKINSLIEQLSLIETEKQTKDSMHKQEFDKKIEKNTALEQKVNVTDPMDMSAIFEKDSAMSNISSLSSDANEIRENLFNLKNEIKEELNKPENKQNFQKLKEKEEEVLKLEVQKESLDKKIEEEEEEEQRRIEAVEEKHRIDEQSRFYYEKEKEIKIEAEQAEKQKKFIQQTQEAENNLPKTEKIESEEEAEEALFKFLKSMAPAYTQYNKYVTDILSDDIYNDKNKHRQDYLRKNQQKYNKYKDEVIKEREKAYNKHIANQPELNMLSRGLSRGSAEGAQLKIDVRSAFQENIDKLMAEFELKQEDQMEKRLEQRRENSLYAAGYLGKALSENQENYKKLIHGINETLKRKQDIKKEGAEKAQNILIEKAEPLQKEEIEREKQKEYLEQQKAQRMRIIKDGLGSSNIPASTDKTYELYSAAQEQKGLVAQHKIAEQKAVIGAAANFGAKIASSFGSLD